MIKEKIIKFLGGYTAEEYDSVETRYKKFVEERLDEQTIQTVNENIYRTLKDLDEYMQDMYGVKTSEWAKRIYDIVHNNKMRILIFHLHNPNSHAIYRLNTNLTGKDIIMKTFQKDVEGSGYNK